MSGGQELKVNGGRIRKVTITEIEDGMDWNWPDPGNMDEENDFTEHGVKEKTTDEVFNILDNVVQDWKIKLEIMIADGLKKIKKTTKEKKAMMKYLPGEGTPTGSRILKRAKESIIQDWTADITKAMETTHHKIEGLGHDKTNETNKMSKGCAGKQDIEDKNEDEKNEKKDLKVRKSMDIRNLMKELDALYQQFIDIPCFGGKVPIYNIDNSAMNRGTSRPRNAPFGWWHPMATLSKMSNYPLKNTISYHEEEKKINDILQDFVAVQKPYSALMKEWNNSRVQKKEVKNKSYRKKDQQRYLKGRKSIHKDRKEREIKRGQQFTLKEFEEAGEKHFYVIRKFKNIMPVVVEAEDIFADWKNNFNRIRRPRCQKPRVRKLSHKKERKELIKEVKKEEDIQIGPMTYSQMLKKNLKLPIEQPPVEDIFESYIELFDTVDCTVVKPSRKLMEDVDFFKVWKHNLHVEADRKEDIDILDTTTCIPSLSAFNCGQPTIKTIQLRENKYNYEKPAAISIQNKKSPEITSYKSMQVVPYVEKLAFTPPSKPTEPIPLPDLYTEANVDSKQNTTVTVEKNIKYPSNVKEEALKQDKNVKPMIPSKQTWTSLILNPIEPSGRNDNELKTPEDVFLTWRHVFAELKPVTSPKTTNEISYMQKEMFFSDWLFNLKEVSQVPINKSSKRDMKTSEPNLSPRQNRKEARKQNKVDELDEVITTIKENRRNDFIKNANIKDKKRNEATRRSTGKRVK